MDTAYLYLGKNAIEFVKDISLCVFSEHLKLNSSQKSCVVFIADSDSLHFSTLYVRLVIKPKPV